MIDAQLPPRLAATLHRAGHDAEHLYVIGMLNAPDRDIWRYAGERGAAIATEDSDFAAMRMNAEIGPAVVWLRLGNVANDALLDAVEQTLPELVKSIEMKESLIEIQ